MIDTLYESFSRGSWVDKSLLLILLVIAVIAVFLILKMAFEFIDSEGVILQSAPAVVVAKSYSPAHTATTLMPVGKVLVPQFRRVPASWYAELLVQGGGRTHCEIRESQFNSLKPGSEVLAHVCRGRISRRLYCDSIKLVRG